MPLEGTTPIYLFYHVTACIPRAQDLSSNVCSLHRFLW